MIFNLKDVAVNQADAREKKEQAQKGTELVKVDPQGANYFTKGALNATAKINFVFAVALTLMKSQGAEVVPLEILYSVADELGIDCSTQKKSSSVRIREHLSHKEVPAFYTEQELTEGKGKKKETYSLEGFSSAEGFFTEATLFDFPAIDFPENALREEAS